MLDASTSIDDTRMSHALSWASDHLGACSSRILTRTPWGATVYLWSDTTSAYLKLLGPGQDHAIEAWESAAIWAEHHVPPVVASDAAHGFLLVADHGADREIRAQDTGIASLVDCITTLQSTTARDAWHVPGAQVVTAMGLLGLADNFFSGSDTVATSLASYIGGDAARHYREVFQACRDTLGCELGAAFALAPCFNHGDLHRRNAALDEAGKVWIHDWDTTYWGPAPLAFAGMLSSVDDIARCVDGAGWFLDTHARDHETVVLGAGLVALAAKGYADEATLRRAFVPGILAGVLTQLLEYRHFKPATDTDFQVCVPHIRQLLGNFVRLAAMSAARSGPQTAALAEALIRAGDITNATFLLHRAVDIQGLEAEALVPAEPLIATESRRILALNKALREAQDPAICPTLPCGPEFVADDTKLSELIGHGNSLFAQYGCLALEAAIPTQVIDNCRVALESSGTGAEGAALSVGDKRAMSAVAVGGAFNDPLLYAARPLVGILSTLLGEDMAIGSYTVVTSEPGAAEQHLHIDHSELYPELARQPDAPPFAVTVLIPLIDIDERVGGTRVLKGSHLLARKEGQALPHQSARIAKGGALMFDYRLFHAGEPNRATFDRPVLSIVFHRSWFRDASNFSSQAPLQITGPERDRIPSAHKSLFAQATLIQDTPA